jgi:hypothetical protein
MRRGSTIFLQAVIGLIGIGSLALLLWEPHLEGRNVHSTLLQIYFEDPFLAYAYTGSIAFFFALLQAFKLLEYVGRGEVFSQRSIKALRTIKYCGVTLMGFLVGAEGYFNIVRRGKDDIAGGVMMGLVLIFVSSVVATAAAVFERTLQSAVELKSENDLTV